MSKVHYVELGPFPGYCGIVFDAKTFAREMDRLGITDPPAFVLEGKHATMHTVDRHDSERLYLTCIDAEAAEGRSGAQVAGLLIHEAVHVWQGIKRDIGETDPGDEVEAYTIQRIAQTFIHAFANR